MAGGTACMLGRCVRSRWVTNASLLAKTSLQPHGHSGPLGGAGMPKRYTQSGIGGREKRSVGRGGGLVCEGIRGLKDGGAEEDDEEGGGWWWRGRESWVWGGCRDWGKAW